MFYKGKFENVVYEREFIGKGVVVHDEIMDGKNFSKVLHWARYLKENKVLSYFKLYVNDVCLVESI